MMSGMRARRSSGAAGGASRGWRGGAIVVCVLAAEKGLAAGTVDWWPLGVIHECGVGCGWGMQGMSPRLADGVGEVVHTIAGAMGGMVSR